MQRVAKTRKSRSTHKDESTDRCDQDNYLYESRSKHKGDEHFGSSVDPPSELEERPDTPTVMVSDVVITEEELARINQLKNNDVIPCQSFMQVTTETDCIHVCPNGHQRSNATTSKFGLHSRPECLKTLITNYGNDVNHCKSPKRDSLYLNIDSRIQESVKHLQDFTDDEKLWSTMPEYYMPDLNKPIERSASNEHITVYKLIKDIVPKSVVSLQDSKREN